MLFFETFLVLSSTIYPIITTSVNNYLQHTIKKNISFKGIGLHYGNIVNVNLTPAEENTGIIFKRTDVKKNQIIKAKYKNVSSTQLCTTISNSSGVSVSTIEHLMAAIYITGIDNLTVEIDNNEVPIMDGSSSDFIEIIKTAGIKEQSKNRKFLKICKEVNLKDGTKSIKIKPNNFGLSIDFELSYENQIIGNQKNKINFYKDQLKDVYSSRTFCLYEDIEKIKKVGLAKGGSLDNAIVVDNKKVLNPNGLRNKNEFVNHKILDLCGDIMLSGSRVLGDVSCKEGGHKITLGLLKKIFEESSNFVLIDIENIELITKDLKKSKINLSATA